MSLAGLLSLAAAPSSAVPSLPYTAKQMENPPPTSSGGTQKASDIRLAIEAPAALLSNVARAAYGEKVADEFTAPGQGVNSPNQEVRLNSAILIADLATISSDKALEKMLGNGDPAVRYWAARGLESIAGNLKLVGPRAAVAALEKAVTAEKSGVVVQQIIQALTAYGDPAAIRTGLKSVVAQMSASRPDVEMLRAAEAGLNALTPSIAGMPANEKADTATVAAALASLDAQQYAAYANTLKAGGEAMPKAYEDATHDVVAAATKVAAAAAGKHYSAPTGTSPADFQFNVNNLFGSPGESNGTLQKDLPATAAPPKVSLAGS